MFDPWLAAWLIIPDILEAFVPVVLYALFAALWHLIARLIEIVTDPASRLLTLGQASPHRLRLSKRQSIELSLLVSPGNRRGCSSFFVVPQMADCA